MRLSTLAACLAAAAVGSLCAPSVSAAQRVDVELSGGAAVGNYTRTDAGLDIVPRPSFGLRADVWFMPSLAGYVGFTRASFGCEEAFCANRDVSLTSQGLVAGAHWSSGLPWARAGVAVQSLNIEATGGADDDADAGVGVEMAGGVSIPVGDRIRIRPGLRYLRHPASTDIGEGHVALLALEVAVSGTVVWF